ncbi:hypothetical protein [Agarivorans sp. QJM3NY_25]|uniref:hypothetical protein n=1 Tax=Agarivorans sp. QJM3NY_25 TaxID=3421430 RepID=UPI003D7E8EA3
MEFRASRQTQATLSFSNDAGEQNYRQEDARLNFTTEYTSNGSLEFSMGSGAPKILELSGTIKAKPLSVSGLVSSLVKLNGVITTDQVNIQGSLSYDINVNRAPRARLNAGTWTTKAAQLRRKHGFHFSDADLVKGTNQTLYHQAHPHQQTTSSKHANSPKLAQAKRDLWEQSCKNQMSLTTYWFNPFRVAQSYTAAMEYGLPTFAATQGDWLNPDAAYQASQQSFGHALAIYLKRHSFAGHGASNHKHWRAYFEQAEGPLHGTRPITQPPTEPVPEPEYFPLNFIQLRLAQAQLEFHPIELDAYIIMNQISCYAELSDDSLVALHPSNVAISLDIDGFSWELSGNLQGDAVVPYLRQSSATPAQLILEINGWQWRFIVRDFRRVRSQTGNQYQFKANSLSQYLGSPYAQTSSGSVTTAINAWQLAEQQLNPLGFGLSRDELSPDWLLATASYQWRDKLPIEVLAEIAKASGAIFCPDPMTKIIAVQPRYRVSPWLWGELADEECDHVIDEDLLVTESAENQTSQQINTVIIAGTNYGVVTEVVKAGSAGDVSAGEVSDPLAQSHQVNAERARNLMADSGEIELLGLKLPLSQPEQFSELIKPGQLCRIKSANGQQTGLCIHNKISAESITQVWQSPTLEIHYYGNH